MGVNLITPKRKKSKPSSQNRSIISKFSHFIKSNKALSIRVLTYTGVAVILLTAFSFFASFFIFPSKIEAHSFDSSEVLQVLHKNQLPSIESKSFTLRSGDVLSNAILREVNDTNGAYEAVRVLRDFIDLRYLQPGQEVDVTYRETDSGLELCSVVIPSSYEKQTIALREPSGRFRVTEIINYLEVQPVLKKGIVESSLYQAGLDAGVPVNRLVEMFDLFAFSIDFQRDIYKNDEFDIIYEELVDGKGNSRGSGVILAAKIVTNSVEQEAFYFEDENGHGEYFDENGKSVKKALLLMPVQGGRLTSGYVNRINPVYGYSEFHPALDFAAPLGTPIMAAGDGTVIYHGWDPKGYGNYVKVRHNNGYVTLYAHMSAFAKSAPVGARVYQGQTIGYIGTTGMSTGPHVHYEIQHNGQKLNPSVVVRNMSSGRTLVNEEKERFLEKIAPFHNQFEDNKTI